MKNDSSNFKMICDEIIEKFEIEVREKSKYGSGLISVLLTTLCKCEKILRMSEEFSKNKINIVREIKKNLRKFKERIMNGVGVQSVCKFLLSIADDMRLLQKNVKTKKSDRTFNGANSSKIGESFKQVEIGSEKSTEEAKCELQF